VLAWSLLPFGCLCSNEVHLTKVLYAKVLYAKVISWLGMLIDANEVHPLAAESSIEVTWSDMLIVCKEVHPWKV
jgi:hypothetical protein